MKCSSVEFCRPKYIEALGWSGCSNSLDRDLHRDIGEQLEEEEVEEEEVEGEQIEEDEEKGRRGR